jgi:purine-binding chemotaxis protein CheW
MAQHRHRHDPSKTLVGFVVGGVHYAVAIAEVREICNPKPLVALPHAPDAVRGVTDYRGHVIPVVDLRVRFGLPPAEETRRIKWIVVDVGGRSVALVVDETLGVFGTAGAGLRPAPPLGAGDDLRGIEGVANHGDAMVFVLDLRTFAELASKLALPESLPPPASLASPPVLPAADARPGAGAKARAR